jgi:hypothetical protein
MIIKTYLRYFEEAYVGRPPKLERGYNLGIRFGATYIHGYVDATDFSFFTLTWSV